MSLRCSVRFASVSTRALFVGSHKDGGACTFGGERPFGCGHDFIGELALRVELLGALHRFELGIFQLRDLPLVERNLVLPRAHLHRSRGALKLLAQARDFRLAILHVRFLASAKAVLFGDQVEHDRALAGNSLGLGFELAYVLRQSGDLVAKALGFDIELLKGPSVWQDRDACGFPLLP